MAAFRTRPCAAKRLKLADCGRLEWRMTRWIQSPAYDDAEERKGRERHLCCKADCAGQWSQPGKVLANRSVKQGDRKRDLQDHQCDEGYGTYENARANFGPDDEALHPNARYTPACRENDGRLDRDGYCRAYAWSKQQNADRSEQEADRKYTSAVSDPGLGAQCKRIAHTLAPHTPVVASYPERRRSGLYNPGRCDPLTRRGRTATHAGRGPVSQFAGSDLRLFGHLECVVDCMTAQVTLSVEGLEHVADVNIASGSAHFHATERSEDMYASIDMVLDKLERQIRAAKGATMAKKRGGTTAGQFAAEAENGAPSVNARTSRS